MMLKVHVYVVCSSTNKLQLQNVEARQACPMNQSENSIKATAALLTEPVLKEAGKSPEV